MDFSNNIAHTCKICGGEIPNHKKECVYTDVQRAIPDFDTPKKSFEEEFGSWNKGTAWKISEGEGTPNHDEFEELSRALQRRISPEAIRRGVEENMLRVEIERNLANTLSRFYFKKNDRRTRGEIKGAVEGYLSDVVCRNGLRDFAVICDESNNTPDDIDNQMLNVTVHFRPNVSPSVTTINIATRGIMPDEHSI